MIIAALGGCYYATPSEYKSTPQEQRVPSPRAADTPADPPTWEIGIVFPGETTCVSFPLEEDSASKVSDIDKITTSCPCLEASARSFVKTKGDEDVAIMVVYQEELKENSPLAAGVQLVIPITIHTTTNKEIMRRVAVYISPG